MSKLPKTKHNLAERVLQGETVVAKVGTGLEQWAIENNLAVYIDRRSIWGNPFVMKSTWRNSTKEQIEIERNSVCDLHEKYIKDNGFPDDIKKLKGKILFCHCAPKRCHGDILATIANQNQC